MNIINVIEAVKKQQPKKAKNVKIVSGTIYSADCPKCGYSFPDVGGVWESYGEVCQYDYCPECGQKIDWKAVMQWQNTRTL